MNSSVIQQLIRDSLSGQKKFPNIVGELTALGVESYHVDLVRGENRYYLPQGETLVEPVPHEHAQAAANFSAAQVAAAVKSSQRGEITYPQFLQQILDAGTVYYIVYLHGQQAVYMGRKGDFHIEKFPGRP